MLWLFGILHDVHFQSSSEKDIKSHYKKLSKVLYVYISSFTHRIAHYLHSHPDKVKLTANDTAESVAARFVELTKAYKAYAAIRPELIWSDLVPGLLMRTSGKISRNMDTRMAGKKSRWVLHFPGGSWRRIIISGCLPFTEVYLASASPLPWYVFSLELRIGVWVETFSCILGEMVVRITPENQGWCFYSDCDQLLEGTH